MKPEAVLQALIDYRIDLAPVIDKAGIAFWTAAVVSLGEDGWSNVPSELDFAQGETPEEAVGALVSKLRRKKSILPPARAPTAPPPLPSDPKIKRQGSYIQVIDMPSIFPDVTTVSTPQAVDLSEVLKMSEPKARRGRRFKP